MLLKVARSLLAMVLPFALACSASAQTPTPAQVKAQAMRIFNLIDLDDNNQLNRFELTFAYGAARAELYLELNDFNGNRKVGRDEFAISIQPYLQQYSKMYKHQKKIVDLQKKIAIAQNQAKLQQLRAQVSQEQQRLHALKDEVNQLMKKAKAQKDKTQKDKKKA